MAKIIGALASERIVAGLVEGNRVTGRVHVYPEPDSDAEGLQGVPAVEIAELIRRLIGLAAGGTKVDAVGVWEGGHMVVSLDPKERYCGCGGVGHLEGIMGNAGMRRRFLDMEPDEVFAEAKAGDQRCAEFVKRWHRALAAATATSIHLE